MNRTSDTHAEIFPPLSRAERVNAWRVARDWARAAYEWWYRAPFEDRRSAYAVYVAAEEQEAAAAEHLRLGSAAAA